MNLTKEGQIFMEQLNKQLIDFILNSELKGHRVGLGNINEVHEVHVINKAKFLEFAPEMTKEIKSLGDVFSVIMKVSHGGLFDKFTITGIFDSQENAFDKLNENLKDAVK